MTRNHEFLRKVLSVSTIEGIADPSYSRKEKVCIEYVYNLACGHIVHRRSQLAGSYPLHRKGIICEWCESGENQIEEEI